MKKLLTSIIASILLIGCATNNNDVQNDYNYFENVDIEKITLSEAYDYMKEGNNGVLFMSFRDCPYCEVAWPIFREVCDEYKDVPVYYVNVNRNERESGEPTYDLWVEALSEFLGEDKNIYMPTIIGVRGGEPTSISIGTIEDIEQMEDASNIERQKDIYRNIFYRSGE